MPYEIVINEYTGGLTGHVNVWFVNSNGSTDAIYGQNLASNEGISGGFLAGGVYNEGASSPANIHVIIVTQQEYNSALAYADNQADITPPPFGGTLAELA